jgi:hypothetical protein
MQATAITLSMIPHPHFDFLNVNNHVINIAFAGALGGAIGVLAYVFINELYNYLND